MNKLNYRGRLSSQIGNSIQQYLVVGQSYDEEADLTTLELAEYE